MAYNLEGSAWTESMKEALKRRRERWERQQGMMIHPLVAVRIAGVERGACKKVCAWGMQASRSQRLMVEI